MFVVLTATLIVCLLLYLFFLRSKDLPEPAAALPFAHLEARRSQIYENLRDLQFEYRVGKLSDADYQTVKNGLQNELALVLADIDRLKGAAPPEAVKAVRRDPKTCPSCGARFPKPLKFCGECGKPMGGNA